MPEFILLPLLKATVYTFPVFAFVMPFLTGIFSVAAVSSDQDSLAFPVLWALTLSAGVIAPAQYALLQYYINYSLIERIPSWYYPVMMVFMLAGGIMVSMLAIRTLTPPWERLKKRLTVRTSLERNRRTDLRDNSNFVPTKIKDFDPAKYYKHGNYFIGLNETNKPVYYQANNLPHVQVAGTSGAGKGVFIGSLCAQVIKNGGALVYIDPKDDEWGPHVVHHAAAEDGAMYRFIDLRPQAPAQINLLAGASAEQIEELFMAAFSLSEKGEAADFYRIKDREAAYKVAQMAGGKNMTAAQVYNKMRDSDVFDEAPYFAGLLLEMAKLRSVNAKKGFDLAEVINNGGAVYVVGSMRNARVIRMQRMLLVRLIQLAEDRPRTKDRRQITVVLDELKYHISRPALEALGAARDKGLSVVMAHQSLADLRDCPADLNPDAVTGAVMENGKLKLIYRIEDPDTAEWLARKSGKILVDDEIRRVEKNVALAEKVNDERSIRQAERYLFDENQILNLPKQVGIVFGVGVPQFVKTSHVRAEKDDAAVIVTPAEESELPITNEEAAKKSIDVEEKQHRNCVDASELI